MYSIDAHTSPVTVTVGSGPIVDLLDVIAALRRDDIGSVKVKPVGDEHRERAERVDWLLYAVGLDVT
jgi:hypothetical protein